MKSTLALIVTALAFAFALSACSQDDGYTPSNPSPSDGHNHTH